MNGNSSVGFERDESLVITTNLSPEELRTKLSEVKPYGGWRHLIHFSNGVKTSDLETAKPWSDRPLNKIKFVQRADAEFAKRGGRALDVGCNCGYNSLWLAHAYDMGVVGIEASASHIATSQLLAQWSGMNRTEFKLADAEIYIEAEAFDLVVHFGTLYHLRNPIRALEAASRNLKIGGVLALETTSHGEKGEMTARYFRGFNGDPSNWWAIGDGALREIVTFCGFGEPLEVFKWTHPSLDGMYRLIWVMRKLRPIQETYEELSAQIEWSKRPRPAS
jgi:SAM-dependent methyltransferase